MVRTGPNTKIYYSSTGSGVGYALEVNGDAKLYQLAIDVLKPCGTAALIAMSFPERQVRVHLCGQPLRVTMP